MDGPNIESAFNESFANCRDGGPCHRPARRLRPTAVMANHRSLPSNRTVIARHTKEIVLSTFVTAIREGAGPCRIRAHGFKVTALEPPADPYLALRSGVQWGHQGTDLGKGLTSSDTFVNAWAERSCSKVCSPTADFADVRGCSPVSKLLVALRIRSLANGGEHAAGDWGSRGRRFKSCHPDGKQQVRGRFGQNSRWPLCCRVATGVATAHVLTSPLLLRAAGRQSARRRWRRGRTRRR